MRKILSIGVFLSAAIAVASHPEAVSWLAAQLLAGLPTRTPGELARDYGVMLLVLGMPTAVLGWGVWNEARVRARSEG